MRGGQIKANITREFDGGYIRLYGKYLDDRSIAFLPNPVRVTGSNGDPITRTSPASRSTRIRCTAATSSRC